MAAKQNLRKLREAVSEEKKSEREVIAKLDHFLSIELYTLNKAIAITELVPQAKEGLRHAEFAKVLGLPKAKVDALLKLIEEAETAKAVTMNEDQFLVIRLAALHSAVFDRLLRKHLEEPSYWKLDQMLTLLREYREIAQPPSFIPPSLNLCSRLGSVVLWTRTVSGEE